MEKDGPKRNFNKKKWRETQYSHKQKVSEWTGKRKQAIQRKYKKMLRKEDAAPTFQQRNPYNEEPNDDDGMEGTSQQRRNNQPSERLSEYQRAKQEYERIQQLKEEKRQEIEAKRKEREAAIEKSKQIRLERIKKLTKKTKKGQPVMKGRIEILLEKIQKQVSSDT